MSRAVVTGAAGFVGSHLVDALLAEGWQVVGVDRRPPAGNLAAALGHPEFTFVPADLAGADLTGPLAGADTVFHLAAIPGVRGSWSDAFAEYVRSNVLATQRLLAAARTVGVGRVVYASSSSVYGDAVGPTPESRTPAPLSPYGVSKLAGEQLCFAHTRHPAATFTAAALRYFTVYGPRQRPDMAMGRILSAALHGETFELYGDGSQRREFTYVGDVVAATIAAARLDRDWAVLNVGGGTSVTVREVLRLAHEVTGRPVPVREVAEQPGDVAATEADLTVARRLLDFRPRVDLRTGLARQAEWLHESELLHPVR